MWKMIDSGCIVRDADRNIFVVVMCDLNQYRSGTKVTAVYALPSCRTDVPVLSEWGQQPIVLSNSTCDDGVWIIAAINLSTVETKS